MKMRKIIFCKVKQECEYEPIKSPLSGCEDSVMMIGISSGRVIIGSIIQFPEDSMVLIVNVPMLYQEMVGVDENQRPVPGTVRAVITKQFQILGIPQRQLFKFNTVYIFNQSVINDQQVVTDYARAVTHFRGVESGIQIVGPDQMPKGGGSNLVQ